MSQQAHVEHGSFGKRIIGIELAKAPYFDGTQPCAQTDPEIFFPESASESVKVKKIVKQMCSSCEFQLPCLDYALNNDVMGIWGGMLDSERRSIKRRNKLSA